MRISVAAGLLILGFSFAGFSQEYPSKPVRILVGFTPGGGPDLTARTIAQKLSESWGQQVLVENRPGAGGTVAAGVVAKAVPDGYTLLSVSSAHAVAAAIYSKLPYDTFKDLSGITQSATSKYVLVVSKNSKSTSRFNRSAQAKNTASCTSACASASTSRSIAR